MEGRTTIVIAHRIATIVLAERVVLLDRGRIVAEGTHEELIRDSLRYRQVLAQLAEQDGAATGAEDESDARPRVLD
jgi:ATP-binding cassette subfamily B protein